MTTPTHFGENEPPATKHPRTFFVEEPSPAEAKVQSLMNDLFDAVERAKTERREQAEAAHPGRNNPLDTESHLD